MIPLCEVVSQNPTNVRQVFKRPNKQYRRAIHGGVRVSFMAVSVLLLLLTYLNNLSLRPTSINKIYHAVVGRWVLHHHAHTAQLVCTGYRGIVVVCV